MINKLFPRIYFDNTKYAEGKPLYMDALAYTVQKHLYMRRNAVYYLGGTITLWDFMTLTRYYISASTSEYGPSDMETYISAMHDPYASFLADDVVKYSQDKKFILLNGTSALVLSMLWAAWIYARVRLDIAIEEKEKWQMAAEQLYDTMRDFYDSPENKSFGENNILLDIAVDAMKTMGTYMAEQIRKGKYSQSQQPPLAKEQPESTREDTSKLQIENERLKAELEELREQVEQFRNKEKGTALGLNQGQAALFGLAMANTFGFNFTNKKKELAPMLHKLFGWGESKLAYYLSTPCDNEERDELANLFKDLCPKLYAIIMNWGELPPVVTPIEKKVTPPK